MKKYVLALPIVTALVFYSACEAENTYEYQHGYEIGYEADTRKDIARDSSMGMIPGTM